jgi:hypothetical protein
MDVEAAVREDIVAEFSVKDRKSAFHLILGSMPPGLRFPNCGTHPGGAPLVLLGGTSCLYEGHIYFEGNMDVK